MTTDHSEQINLVWGISGIAKVIGRTDRQTHGMLASGALPARQIGHRWVAKREALERFFDEVAA